MLHIGQEITSFHPFVPRVDCNQFGAVGALVYIFFRLLQESCKTFWRVIVMNHFFGCFIRETRGVILLMHLGRMAHPMKPVSLSIDRDVAWLLYPMPDNLLRMAIPNCILSHCLLLPLQQVL